MSFSLSIEAIVWIIVFSSVLIVAIIWAFYKLYSYIRSRQDAEISRRHASIDSSVVYEPSEPEDADKIQLNLIRLEDSGSEAGT